ncbi:MAG TPA: cyclic nucleotide-binding domain-containing protein [Burkholderiaceae bacterium]|nr:cyclic nucleotide-binding domain-containing protein [Burkholderiaceae bacterium]
MADDAPSELLSRRHRMFPVLSDADIARMQRFGEVRTFGRGDALFAAGRANDGMFVVIKGLVALSQRDGLGTVVPIIRQGHGQFAAEVGTLSGQPLPVDASINGSSNRLAEEGMEPGLQPVSRGEELTDGASDE